MKRENIAPRRGKTVFIYAIMILILLSLLVTASYTWFSISRTPRVSSIGLYINAPTGMVISTAPEGEEWVHRLDFAELAAETSPLRPVTWSQQEQRFFAARYGNDGRRTGEWEPLSDDLNANRDDVYGYYIKTTIYATTDTAVNVGLTHAVEVEEGVSGSGTYLIGSPLWDQDNLLHSDGGHGAQNAMRIGLRFTPLDNGAEQADRSLFYIYEPNCDTHVKEADGYLATESMDGTDALVPAERLIRQTTTSWTEADPVQHGVVVRDMGEFLDDTHLYRLAPQDIVRIDLYVWLEGQDVDCTNRIGQEAQILANVQFYADPGGQSGLQPIPGA